MTESAFWAERKDQETGTFTCPCGITGLEMKICGPTAKPHNVGKSFVSCDACGMWSLLQGKPKLQGKSKTTTATATVPIQLPPQPGQAEPPLAKRARVGVAADDAELQTKLNEFILSSTQREGQMLKHLEGIMAILSGQGKE